MADTENDLRAHILTVPSEEAMQHFLDGLNVSGEHPELACSTQAGTSFLAGLTEPDADHVHYTMTDADSGVVHCCQCAHPDEAAGSWDPNSWRPVYPVLALVLTMPDPQRVADNDFIEPWWVPAHAAPSDAPQGEGGLCQEFVETGACPHFDMEHDAMADFAEAARRAPTPAPVTDRDAGLSDAEREALRQWLYDHNGAMGPNPVTDGAGGLGGLWSAVERILAAHAAPNNAPQGEGFTGPEPCVPSGCGCLGHRVPGVSHMKPCCEEPHVDFAARADHGASDSPPRGRWLHAHTRACDVQDWFQRGEEGDLPSCSCGPGVSATGAGE